MRSSAASIVLAGAIAAGCGRSAPPSPSPGAAPAESITGRERLGWDQRAADPEELATFHYALYVDGARQEVSAAACEPYAQASGFPCTAPLPPLDPGRHLLELATFINDGGTFLESPRSAALSVVVAAAVVRSVTAPAAVVTTADGVGLRVRTIAQGFALPVDLAIVPDGRLLVVERSGVAYVIHGEDVRSAPLPLENGDAPNASIVGVAVDPQFDRTHAVFVLYAAAASDARTYRVARLQEVDGRLGDPAVIFDAGTPSPEPRGAIRFGTDGKLYLALEAARDAVDTESLSSVNGKILRLEADGTTPRDQAGGSPLFSWTYDSPRGLDWQPGTGLLWIADATSAGRTTIAAVGVEDAVRVRGTVRLGYEPPGHASVSGLAFYRGRALPQFRGDLLATDGPSGQILRLEMDRRAPLRIARVERILERGGGAIRGIGVAPDGVIYVIRGNALLAIDALQP